MWEALQVVESTEDKVLKNKLAYVHEQLMAIAAQIKQGIQLDCSEPFLQEYQSIDKSQVNVIEKTKYSKLNLLKNKLKKVLNIRRKIKI